MQDTLIRENDLCEILVQFIAWIEANYLTEPQTFDDMEDMINDYIKLTKGERGDG